MACAGESSTGSRYEVAASEVASSASRSRRAAWLRLARSRIGELTQAARGRYARALVNWRAPASVCAAWHLPRGFLGVSHDVVIAFERGEWHELSASIVAGDGSVDALLGYSSCDVVEYSFTIGTLIGRYAGPDIGRGNSRRLDCCLVCRPCRRLARCPARRLACRSHRRLARRPA